MDNDLIGICQPPGQRLQFSKRPFGIQLELGSKVNKPNLRVAFPSGAEIYVGSVSQHHDVYKYAGRNFHKIFINEYVNEEDAAYLSARSRSTNPDLKPEVIRDPV